MHVEFQSLEQRPGAHTVPVRMTREELESVAEKMANLNTLIEAHEDNLRSYAKEVRDQVKDLELERHGVTSVYRFKRDPKLVDGLWGFEFENQGRVRCKTCVERSEKKDEEFWFTGQYDTTDELLKAHEEFEWTDGDKHPVNPVWERPLGTKWFVDPKSGDVFGPVSVTEKDLQRELPPATQEFQPYALTFDADTAVPLLDAVQVSAAEKKLKETEAIEQHEERFLIDEDIHDECGLPVAWHPVHDDDDPETWDACKAAMLRGANEAQQAQEQRTAEKYGGDIVLDPVATYPCGKCKVETFGRDLQAVSMAGKTEHVCFACEKDIPTGDQASPENPVKPKRKAKKKAGK